MGIQLKEFRENRLELTDQLQQYSSFLQQLDAEDEQKKINELIEGIQENNFQLVVVGEFSRGKSTFINALLGSKTLPSSAKPTTTVLSKIVYGKETEIGLHFHDERKKTEFMSEDDFKKLVAPTDPILGDASSEEEYANQVSFISGIQYAEIRKNLAICENGVEIIDTPGTNDLDPLREEITNTIIPRSDAAILLLSALKILSESEMSLLRDRLLSSDIQKIFIVINFMDELESEADKEKVIDFTYRHLKDILHEPKIFLVSAKQALNARLQKNGEVLPTRRGRPIEIWNFEETGFVELEKELAEFLQYERGKVKLNKPLNQALLSLKDIEKRHIDFEIRALEVKSKDLANKVKEFRPRVDAARGIAKDAKKQLRGALKLNEEKIKDWYEAELSKVSTLGLSTYDEFKHLPENEISQKVEHAIAPEERRIFEEKKRKMNAIAKESIQMASVTLNEEWTKMEGELDSFLQQASGAPMELAIAFEKGPDAVNDFFKPLYQELEESWENSKSTLKRIGIAAEAAIIGTIHGVSKIWNFFVKSASDSKTEYRRDLRVRFDEMNKSKKEILSDEYDSMAKFLEKQHANISKSYLKSVDKQLDQLLKSTRLKEKDILRRKEVLLGQKEFLNKVRRNLISLSSRIERQLEKKVNVL